MVNLVESLSVSHEKPSKVSVEKRIRYTRDELLEHLHAVKLTIPEFKPNFNATSITMAPFLRREMKHLMEFQLSRTLPKRVAELEHDGQFPLREAVMEHLEYYFSVEHLSHDKFLNRRDDWVPIDVIMNYQRIRAISTSPETIMRIIKTTPSDIIEIDYQREKIRRDKKLEGPVDHDINV